MESLLIKCNCVNCLERRLHEANAKCERLRRLVVMQGDEIERLRELTRSEAERIAAQSELLARRAEK